MAGSLRRYWWLVVGLAVLGAAAAGIFSILQHKEYTSEASLAIPPPTSQQLLGSSATGTSNEYIAAQVATLKSPQVAAVAANIIRQKLGSGPSANSITKHVVITPPVNAGNGSAASSAATASVSYTAKKPDVAAVTANAVITGYGEVRAHNLNAQASAAEAKLTSNINSIDQQLATTTSQISTLQAQLTSSSEAEQQQLLREGDKSGHAETSNASLQALLAQESGLDKQQADLEAHQNDIESNLEQALAQPLSVIPATDPTSPSSPKTLRNVGLGALALLILGIILAYVLAVRRRRFADRHDPSLLFGAPLLGDVPRLQAEKIDSPMPILTDPVSGAAESFRFLAASLGTVLPAHQHPPVVLTSATPGCGKTTMTANVAEALALRGWKVLAVDADYIRRGLTNLLLEEDAEGIGLCDVLAEEIDVERAARPVTLDPALGDRLSLLTPGVGAHLLPGIIAARTADEFKSLICEPYDAVLVDGPPLAGVAFAADLASLVGSIIVVVNHDDLVGPQLEFVDHLRATSGHIIGYIYNRAPLRKEMGAYYRYHTKVAADSPNNERRRSVATEPARTATLAPERPTPPATGSNPEEVEVAKWVAASPPPTGTAPASPNGGSGDAARSPGPRTANP